MNGQSIPATNLLVNAPDMSLELAERLLAEVKNSAGRMAGTSAP